MFHHKNAFIRLPAVPVLLVCLCALLGIAGFAADTSAQEDSAYVPSDLVLPEEAAAVTLDTATPSSWDARDYGYVPTTVRTRNPYNNSWAFAAVGQAEVYALKNGLLSATAATIDLSEWHLTWFAFHSATDPLGLIANDTAQVTSSGTSYLNAGSNAISAAFTLASRRGIAAESATGTAWSTVVADKTAAIDSAWGYEDALVLTESEWLSLSSANRAAVKTLLMKYGAADVSLYFINNKAYFNSVVGSYYQSTTTGTNTECVLIGWDDNYSASNFVVTPPGDGAWLLRNDRGSAWGDGGYFWVSYYDASLEDNNVVFNAYKTPVKGETLYQYDGGSYSGSLYLEGSGISASLANVYTVSGGARNLTSVMLCSYQAGAQYTLKIYTGLTAGATNPAEGVPALTQTGTFSTAGYHSIELNSPVYLADGETFSVVVTLQDAPMVNASGATTRGVVLPVSMNASKAGIRYYQTVSAGRSFLLTSGASEWTDLSTYSGGVVARIKAVTLPVAGRLLVSYDPNGGTCSTGSAYVTEGETYGALPTPARTGYTFSGWYTAAEGGSLVSATTPVTSSGKQTLYAHWTPVDYTVTLSAVGAAVTPTTVTVHYGEPYGALPTAEKSYCTFLGWYTAAEGGALVTADTIVSRTGAHTLYARFAAETLTVTLNPNGGTCSESTLTLACGGTYGTLPTPTRTGYTFSGWYTMKTAGTAVTASSVVTASGSQTLYARWTPVDYTVTLSADGATVTPASILVRYGEAYGTLPEAVRAHYTFDGWYTAATGGTKVTASTSVTRAENHTLYARFTADTFTLTFDPAGGTCAEASRVVAYGSVYGELPVPERAGYDFAGWYTASTGGARLLATDTVTITANRTVYARWTPAAVAVTLDPNGGAVTPAAIAPIYTGTYGELPTPTREHYTFSGWYTAATGGTKVTASTSVTRAEAHTLYAHWKADILSVTFDPNGGEITDTSRLVAYNSMYGTLPTPTLEGYRFAGWFTAPSGGDQISATTRLSIGEDHTLYAHWLGVECVVTLDAREGTVSPASVTVNHDGVYGELPTPTFTGHTFLGWFTDPAAGEQVTAATTVTAVTDHTLYARWAVNSYTVTFDPAGGTCSETSRTVVYGAAYGNLPVPTRDENHAFLGWFTSDGGSVSRTELVSIDSDHTLTARWSVLRCTVTFLSNGHGTAPAALTLTPGTVMSRPETPYCLGYVFTGWYTDSACSAAWDFSEPITDDLVLYAGWSPAGEFEDVPVNEYYYGSVRWALSRGITNGVDETHFAPNDSCTRGQVVTFLWRAAGQPAVSASTVNPFTDVSSDAYYYRAVLWAVQKGITAGTSATTFEPDAVCTRGQVVTFLWRAAGQPAVSSLVCPFTDVIDADYYYTPVLWAYENAITSGTSATTFSPADECTRAQVVTFLCRADNV